MSPALARAARELGWQLSGPRRAMLAELGAQLAKVRKPNIAILVGPEPSPLVQVLRAAYPKAALFVRPVTTDRSALHAELAAHGRFDLIVDDSRSAGSRRSLFERTFWHLRRGGAFLVRDYRPKPWPVDQRPYDQVLWPFINRLLALRGREGTGTYGRRRDEIALAAAMGRVVLGDEHLLVGTRVAALAKLREGETDTFLDIRGVQTGRVLAQLPPTRFTSRCQLRQNVPTDDSRLTGEYDVPALSVREYRDVTCIPAQVVVRGNVILPDSYRHNRYPRLHNRRTVELAPRFAQVPDAEPRQQLAGSYFYLDAEFRSHFGHLMTEQISRLWAWQRAKDADPDLKVLMSCHAGRSSLAPFELEILAGAGIDAGDVVAITAPAQVERLVAATPMLSMPTYVHPDIAGIWTTIGDALAASAPPRAYPRAIFLTRNQHIRACHNAIEVEARFAAAGFEAYRPESLSLPEQVELFRHADVIAGYGGSSLLGLLYCKHPKDVITISAESYTSNNEYMISAVRGHRLHRILCPPDAPHPDHGWTWDAFYSDFSFDFNRDGSWLDETLTLVSQPPPQDPEPETATTNSGPS